jgi:hypothetical protein
MAPEMPEDQPVDVRIEVERRTTLGQAQQVTEETAQKLLSFLEKSEPVRRLRGSQIASAVTGTIGFSLFIFGVERAAEDLPIVSNPYGAMGVGFLLLLATGLLLRKLMGSE